MAATPVRSHSNTHHNKKKQTSIDYTSIKNIHPELDCYTIEETPRMEKNPSIQPFTLDDTEPEYVDKNQVIIEDETYKKED